VRSTVILAAVLMAAPVAGAQGPPKPSPAGQLILDEGAYWRHYVEFGLDRIDGKLLKADGEKVLGEKGMARLERMVRRWSGPPFVTAAEAGRLARSDWRDDPPFWVTQVVNVGCDDERICFHVRSVSPPDDWTSPESAAPAAWPRQRLPLLVGNIYRLGRMHGDLEMQQLNVRAAYFRSAFEVADPAAGYTLKLVYRGGARVFVNGKEIARGHLPAGELTAETVGASYPLEAYVCRPNESSKAWRDRLIRRTGSEYVDFCPDLVGNFEDARLQTGGRAGADARGGSTELAEVRGGGSGEYWRGVINRKGWDRITASRNRTIGPVVIPRRLLRKGPNVLAVEARAARLHPIVAGGKGADWGRSFIMGANYTWSHCRLLALQLRCSAEDAPSAVRRRPGVQVWVEDVHRRMYSTEFGDVASLRPGPGVVRMVGGRNGTYSGQVVVGSDRRLTGLKAEPGPLVSADGPGAPGLPASVVKVSYLLGHPVTEMVKLGQWRGLPEIMQDPLCPTSEMALLRHAAARFRQRRPPRPERLAEITRLRFFDHISPSPPPAVPADTCQPIWLSVKVPADARPGTYRGSIRVAADGMAAVAVPLELEVFDWNVPDPIHFQSFLAAEQSPYGVAKHYKVPLWSERHFELMEGSFRQLFERLGSRWVFVPVIQLTEFGNVKDSMIRWTRTPEGKLAFDYRILDRYLNLAIRHLGGGGDAQARGRAPAHQLAGGSAKPLVICFVVAHGTSAGAPATVEVLDAATGKTETLDLSAASPAYRANWKAFATDLYDHMKDMGLAESLHWGFGWDGIGDDRLIPLLAEFAPDAARWARSSHAYSRAPRGWAAAFTASSFIYDVPITEHSRRGWQRKDLCMINPRAGCSVISANGHSPPFAYRLLMDRALTAGTRGLARLGADYWDGVFYQGYEGRAWAGSLPGMGCHGLLWPGKGGAEPSQRLEALLEGIQEAEARIFLEQALQRGNLPDELAEKARQAVEGHHLETLYVPVGRIGVQIQEYSAGWQARSRRLYAAAAEVAAAVGLDVDRAEIVREVPARGKAWAFLTLRNWSGRERAWKLLADRPWLLPESSEGRLIGHETVAVTLDAGRLQPGRTAEATITVTDLSSGASFPVKVTAKVGRVFHFVVGPAYDFLGAPAHASSWGPKRIEDFATFNVTAGGAAETREFVLINHSGAELNWKIAAPVPWLKVAPARQGDAVASPASGSLPAGRRAYVKVTAAPPGNETATHAVDLVISERDDRTRQEARLVVHVIPPYAAPKGLPAGRPVPLSSLPKSMVKAHRSRAYWYGTSDRRRNDYGPVFDAKGEMPGGTPQFTVYDIAGKGYSAFSAQVRLCPQRGQAGETPAGRRVNFEVHVDGRIRAQSGLMTASDQPRLLVVDGLAARLQAGGQAAREVRLVTRYDRPESENIGATAGIAWSRASFYKAE